MSELLDDGEIFLILRAALSRPIIQSGFRASPPAYPLLHIDAFTTALAKAPRTSDIDPILYVPTPEAPSACCHVHRGDVRILCPISGDGKLKHLLIRIATESRAVDPLLAFAFLQTFIEILLEYFETLSAATLKDNFDVVYQVGPFLLLLRSIIDWFAAPRGNTRLRRPPVNHIYQRPA